MKSFRNAIRHLIDSTRPLDADQDQLIELLESMPDEHYSEGDTERILQAGTKAIRENQLKKWGYKRREHWDKKGPVDLDLHHERWIDHPYRLYKEGKKWYVSEPYNLDDEGFEALGELVRRGWNVHVTSWQATHFPGHTLAIWISSVS